MMLATTLLFGACAGLFCTLLVFYSYTGPYHNARVERGVRAVLNTLGWVGTLALPVTVLLWFI